MNINRCDDNVMMIQVLGTPGSNNYHITSNNNDNGSSAGEGDDDHHGAIFETTLVSLYPGHLTLSLPPPLPPPTPLLMMI